MASMDLVWHSNDLNGCALNPRWEHQLSPGGRPDPRILCGDPRNNPGCTTQATQIDDAGICYLSPIIGEYYWYIAGHWNWMTPVTYQGSIWWRDHSGSDDDYNFKLVTGEAGLTVTNDDGFVVEFDSDETIDHFVHPWWTSFHNAVDNGNPGQMINGRAAIVTGVIGLDCGHDDVHAELHPVWAMGIQLYNDGYYTSLWAIFVRNWGDEGYCSSHDQQLEIRSYTFRLPWQEGASSVDVDPATVFYTNKNNLTWSIGFTSHVEVRLTFTLPPPDEHARIHGTILLRWTLDKPPIVYIDTSPGTSGSVSETQSPPALERRNPNETSEQDAGEVEMIINDTLAKMTAQQRDIYFSMLPKEASSYDEIVVRRVESVVDQQPSQPPSITVKPYPRHVEKIRRRLQAVRAAYGGQIPGIDPDSLERYLGQ